MNLTETSIKDLKKGNVVNFYEHAFIVTEDARKSDSQEDVFVVPCKIKQPSTDASIGSTLNSYDYFQGTEAVTFSKIN